MSSDSSLTIVTMSTKARGATKDMRKPTLSAGTIYDRAIRRKKRLKKYLNWWKSTRGTKDHQLYLQLLMALPGYPNFCFKSGVNLISLNCTKRVLLGARRTYFTEIQIFFLFLLGSLRFVIGLNTTKSDLFIVLVLSKLDVFLLIHFQL